MGSGFWGGGFNNRDRLPGTLYYPATQHILRGSPVIFFQGTFPTTFLGYFYSGYFMVSSLISYRYFPAFPFIISFFYRVTFPIIFSFRVFL